MSHLHLLPHLRCAIHLTSRSKTGCSQLPRSSLPNGFLQNNTLYLWWIQFFFRPCCCIRWRRFLCWWGGGGYADECQCCILKIFYSRLQKSLLIIPVYLSSDSFLELKLRCQESIGREHCGFQLFCFSVFWIVYVATGIFSDLFELSPAEFVM